MRRANDLTLFERNASDWWNSRSAAFRSLHSVNRFRVELLRDWLGTDLSGRVVVDLGCGGGLLAEPLVRAGARLIGVDISHGSLLAAREHVGAGFVRGDALRVPILEGTADLVLFADVLEHVSPIGTALDEAARLLRPGGLLYVSTINRTALARWLAIDVAEGLRLVPPGTHDHRLFVPVETLRREASARGLERERLQGESVDVIRTVLRRAVVLRRGDGVSIGYSALFRRGEPT